MGWCSATEIMDAAVEAAEQAAYAMLNKAAQHYGFEPEHTKTEAKPLIDDTLRPFVAKIAEALRDGDWDCIEESDYFDRFRQEMLGYDDEAMIGWYRDRLAEVDDAERVSEYSTAMIELMRKRD
jgi:hypothetical protein